MKPQSVYSLRKKTRQYFRRALLAFTAILLGLLLAMLSIANTLTRDYLDLGLHQVAQNISNYFNQIEKSTVYISSNTAFIDYYSFLNPAPDAGSITDMYEMANTLCNQLPSLLDLSVVSVDGRSNSYHSGYGYTVMPALRTMGLFDENEIARGFVFFDADAETASQFVYYFPILDFVSETHPESRKTATAILLFDKLTVSDFLTAAADGGTAYHLRFEGMPVCGSTFADGSAVRASIPLANHGFELTGTARTSLFNMPVFWQFGALLLVLLLFVFICLITIERFVNLYISRPIDGLLEQMSGFDSISCRTLLEPAGVEEIDRIVDTTNQMILALQENSRQILRTQDHLYEVELREKENELYALQSQLNPHFLYNTLECIRGLATVGQTEDIKTIVQQLSSFYRYSVLPEPFVTILDEVEIIYQYLNIYQLRTSGRLTYDIDIPDELLDCDIVRMTLQPIVENCIAHGFVSKADAPHIQIAGAREGDDCILLRIIDNGCGMSYEQLTSLRRQLDYTFNESLMRGNKHLGLYNLNRRIKLLLGERYGLSVFSNPNGTEVDLLLPLLSAQPLPQQPDP